MAIEIIPSKQAKKHPQTKFDKILDDRSGKKIQQFSDKHRLLFSGRNFRGEE